MDQPDIPLRSEPSASRDGQLESQLRLLRGTVTMLLIACCCLGAGLALFLYRQVAQVNTQVTEAKRVVDEYQTNQFPRIKWFVESLQTFARTNTDFNPILAKYNLLPTNAPPPSGVPAAGKK